MTTNSGPEKQSLAGTRIPGQSETVKWLFTAAGIVFVILGLVGAVLPIMPTTIFMLAAVACFARSSPRLEAWILDHRHFGPPVRLWREHRAIGPWAKLGSIVSIYVGLAFVVYMDFAPTAVDVTLGVVLSLVALFIASRPSGPTRP